MNTTAFDLGITFRSHKIWRHLREEELFAVRLDSTEEIAYCSIMGELGEHLCLSVHIGNKGILSYYKMHTAAYNMLNGTAPDYSVLLSQDCIQCSIESTEEFEGDELSEIRAYAKSKHLRAPYPMFRRFKPNCVPWFIHDQADWEHLIKCLKVTNQLAEALKHQKKEALGIHVINFEALLSQHGGQMSVFSTEDEFSIPLFDLDKAGQLVQAGQVQLPPQEEETYTPPTLPDELSLTRLKKAKKRGTLQCELIRVPSPVMDDEQVGPYLPAMLLAVSVKDGMVLPVKPVSGAVYDPDEVISEFIEVLNQGVVPREIHARTPETVTLLKSFCERTGIKLATRQNLPELDEAYDHLSRYMDDSLDDDFDDEFDEDDDSLDGRSTEAMLQALAKLSVNELRTMPNDMKEFLMFMDSHDALPPELSAKLKKL